MALRLSFHGSVWLVCMLIRVHWSGVLGRQRPNAASVQQLFTVGSQSHREEACQCVCSSFWSIPTFVEIDFKIWCFQAKKKDEYWGVNVSFRWGKKNLWSTFRSSGDIIRSIISIKNCQSDTLEAFSFANCCQALVLFVNTCSVQTR